MPFTVATWKVNSVRKRLDHVARLARETTIDVLCLQETKVVNDLFPAEAMTEMGFAHQAIAGMKGYNGVAILSRRPLSDVRVEPWLGRDDCRHVHARVETGSGPVEVHSLYVPAGGDDPNPEANPKFAYKLDFLDALAPFLAARAASDIPSVLTGDLNVAPLETDVWSHERLKRVITHTPIERDKLKGLLNGDNGDGGGWTDALRRFVPADQKVFTWWSYRAADWRAADKGRRLDHIWINPALAPALSFAAVHDEVRDWPEPSDHAPVRAVFEIG
ncbi:MAG: exodeoxyribonuclease III [Rhodospirillales bacterium]